MAVPGGEARTVGHDQHAQRSQPTTRIKWQPFRVSRAPGTVRGTGPGTADDVDCAKQIPVPRPMIVLSSHSIYTFIGVYTNIFSRLLSVAITRKTDTNPVPYFSPEV